MTLCNIYLVSLCSCFLTLRELVSINSPTIYVLVLISHSCIWIIDLVYLTRTRLSRLLILIRMNFKLVSAKLFIRLAIVIAFPAKPPSIIGNFAWNQLHVKPILHLQFSSDVFVLHSRNSFPIVFI